MAKYSEATLASFSKKVHPREIVPGDLFLKRKVNPVAVGKLESKWEGPYLVVHRLRID